MWIPRRAPQSQTNFQISFIPFPVDTSHIVIIIYQKPFAKKTNKILYIIYQLSIIIYYGYIKSSSSINWSLQVTPCDPRGRPNLPGTWIPSLDPAPGPLEKRLVIHSQKIWQTHGFRGNWNTFWQFQIFGSHDVTWRHGNQELEATTHLTNSIACLVLNQPFDAVKKWGIHRWIHRILSILHIIYSV